MTKTVALSADRVSAIQSAINEYEEQGWSVKQIESVGQPRPYGNYGSMAGHYDVLVVLTRDGTEE